MIHHPRESHQPSNASKSLPLVAKTFVEKTNRSSHMKQGEGKIDPLGKWKNIGRVEPLQKKDVQVKVDHLPTESHVHFWDEYFEKHVWNHQGVHFIGPNWKTLSGSRKWDYMGLPHVDGHWSWKLLSQNENLSILTYFCDLIDVPIFFPNFHGQPPCQSLMGVV